MGTRYLVGTSGFTYKHWKDVFYPTGIPQKRWLEYYATQFSTVEMNNTFYRLPEAATVQGWHDRVPEDLVFAVKASRRITHYQRLQDAQEPLGLFLQRAELLGEKLGPILFQLPPSLHKDFDLLSSFLALLPHDIQYVMEFRHSSWYVEEVYDLLCKRDVAFCIHDMRGSESPDKATAKTAYLRFHGTQGHYLGGYSDQDLETWANRMRGLPNEVSTVYVFFNNDIGGDAVRNARTMTALLARRT